MSPAAFACAGFFGLGDVFLQELDGFRDVRDRVGPDFALDGEEAVEADGVKCREVLGPRHTAFAQRAHS